jgi:hypothetical protein
MKLLQYIQGNRRGKEINRLERDAMRDPFLADALDGFDSVAGDNHLSRINEMRTGILHKTKSGSRHVLRYLSIAAGLLLIIVPGGYFLLDGNRSRTEENLTQTQFELYLPWKKIMNGDGTDVRDETQPDRQPEKERRTGKSLPAQTGTGSKKETATAMLRKQETLLPDTAAQNSDTAALNMEALTAVAAREDRETEILPVEKRRGRIAGIVTDPQGEPLVGATVRYSGTDTGVVSDLNGYFELPESEKREIRIDFIGYKPVNLVADTNKTMLVAMKEDSAALDEITVVAFGRQKKESVVGAAPLPEGKNVRPRPVTGRKEYKKYLKENRLTLQSEECKGKKGTVNLKFSIDGDGRPTNIRVIKSLCPEADRDAIRLIDWGPDWTQGSRGEVEIKIKYP